MPHGVFWLQRVDSNHRSPGYEPGQIPLLTLCVNQLQLFMSGGQGRIQTYESNALQAQPLSLSGT